MSITKGINQFVLLVATYIDNAMVAIHASICCFDGYFDRSSWLTTANGIVALFQWQHLLETKYIFDNGDATKLFAKGLFIELFLFLGCFLLRTELGEV